ncbi:MAG: BMP family ABC transporter substrate-binding protein [Pseudomonadales bacterium]|nr:BMP family ABC transporter substrate-binding protein [Pseudomonadales bacterium]
MRRSFMKKLLTTAASIALVSALSISAVAADKLKVGFIYIGPPGDFGWTYQHDQGRQAIDARLGDHAETVFVENVPEGPDAERTITRLARQGAGLIFTTSFGYMDPTLNVAAKFPDVKFEHATGYKRTDNVSTYGARFYEGRYVIGQIAAKMSKSGVAGYIGSFPIPEVVRGINAFLLGAQTVNPDFKLKVVWANSWFDPGREADAAKVLISQGADIITQHTDSTAAVQVAEAQGVYAFGQASDMAAFAPNALLTSIIDNWADYYVDRTQAVLDGSWVSTDTFGGMDANMVQMGPFVNMPADVKAMAETTTAAITSGELHPFAGPVYKQDGSLAAAEGEVVDLGTLLGMDWYVKGVDDQL